MIHIRESKDGTIRLNIADRFGNVDIITVCTYAELEQLSNEIECALRFRNETQ
jgi:hypothetical protein